MRFVRIALVWCLPQADSLALGYSIHHHYNEIPASLYDVTWPVGKWSWLIEPQLYVDLCKITSYDASDVPFIQRSRAASPLSEVPTLDCRSHHISYKIPCFPPGQPLIICWRDIAGDSFWFHHTIMLSCQVSDASLVLHAATCMLLEMIPSCGLASAIKFFFVSRKSAQQSMSDGIKSDVN